MSDTSPEGVFLIAQQAIERGDWKDVSVTGSKAVAVRRHRGGDEEPVSFVLERGAWHVRLFGRARAV